MISCHGLSISNKKLPWKVESTHFVFRKVKCYINDGKTLDPLEMNLKKKEIQRWHYVHLSVFASVPTNIEGLKEELQLSQWIKYFWFQEEGQVLEDVD